jgi:hypothetical protein
MHLGCAQNPLVFIRDFSHTTPLAVSVGFPTSRWSFPGCFRFRFFTHYLDMLFTTYPRRSDCPGSFRSAQPMRTDLPIDIERKIDLHTVKFLPSYRSCNLATFSSWNPHAFSCQGTDHFMSFALFTTLLRRVRLSQDNRWLDGMFILPFMLEIGPKMRHQMLKERVLNLLTLISGLLTAFHPTTKLSGVLAALDTTPSRSPWGSSRRDDNS